MPKVNEELKNWGSSLDRPADDSSQSTDNYPRLEMQKPNPTSPKKSTSSFFKKPTSNVENEKFGALVEAMQRSPHYQELKARDTDATWVSADKWSYELENSIAANGSIPFYILMLLSLVFTFLLGIIWMLLVDDKQNGGEHEPTEDLWGAIFMTFQVLITGGYDNTIRKPVERFLFFVMIMVGVLVVSILIGLITDSVNGYMEELTLGSSKVVEKGHTLILGYNEATPRVLAQIAFIRRTFLIQNERWDRKWMPWRRVKPSTPVAAAPIVLLWDGKTKEEMEDLTRNNFAERGINPKRTMVGRDVIFRCGDPCSAHDLVRVAAHEATSILIMMTEKDEKEEEESANEDGKGILPNSATLRCLLSLRNIIYSNSNLPNETFTPDLRVVIQLHAACPFIDAAGFLDLNGLNCVFPQDLSKYLNISMFQCAGQPGLSRVLMEIMNFGDVAIRSRTPALTHGGPSNEEGWMEGKTVGICMREHSWIDGSIMLGVDDAIYNEFDEKGDTDGYTQKGDAGICSDPNRIVREDDHIIFLSKTSNPQGGNTKSFQEEAKKLQENCPEKILKSAKEDSKRAPKNVILCGWRPEWTKDVQRFKGRILDVAENLPENSTVTCINKLSKADFQRLMSQLKYKPKEVKDSEVTEYKAEKMSIRHFEGDAVDYSDMEKLFKNNRNRGEHFSAAICLGTVAGRKVSADLCDARILTILMILRHLAEKYQEFKQLHITAENRQDQTSQIGMAPEVAGGGDEPDFINTQAIIARSLVMNLSYPQISDAVKELVTPNTHAPMVHVIRPSELGIDGITTTFGALQLYFFDKHRGFGIIIGYMKGEDLRLGCKLNEKIKWEDEDRIICIQRLPPDYANDNEGETL